MLNDGIKRVYPDNAPTFWRVFANFCERNGTNWIPLCWWQFSCAAVARREDKIHLSTTRVFLSVSPVASGKCDYVNIRKFIAFLISGLCWLWPGEILRWSLRKIKSFTVTGPIISVPMQDPLGNYPVWYLSRGWSQWFVVLQVVVPSIGYETFPPTSPIHQTRVRILLKRKSSVQVSVNFDD